MYVIGAGGHGREVLEALRLTGHAVAGFIDEDSRLWGQTVLEVPVVGGLDWLERLPAGETECICAIGDNATRKRVVERLAGRFAFVRAVHPAAVVFSSAALGQGVMIGAGAVVSSEAVIGDHAIVNCRASASHDVRVSPFANLNPGSIVAGAVTIGEGANVGAGATVIQSLTVGEWSVIGAGAVVIRDVPPGVTVVGVPARPVKRRAGRKEDLS